jgi:hypothetical protein
MRKLGLARFQRVHKWANLNISAMLKAFHGV